VKPFATDLAADVHLRTAVRNEFGTIRTAKWSAGICRHTMVPDRFRDKVSGISYDRQWQTIRSFPFIDVYCVRQTSWNKRRV